MKTFKKLFAGFAFLAALLLVSAPSFAQSGYNWQIYVEDENGAILTSSTEVWVFAVDGESTATIYSDRRLGTVTTNPVVPDNTTGKVSFWISTATTALDIVVRNNDTDKGPCVARRASFARTDKRIKCFRNGAIKLLVIRLAGTANDVTEKDTGIDLPDNAIVYHAALITREGNTSQTTDVGILSSETGGDANGYCAAADTSAAGYDRCSGALLTTAGVPDHILTSDGNSISFTFVEGASADVDFIMTYAEAFNR